MSQPQPDAALLAAQNYEKNAVTYTTGPFAAFLLGRAAPRPGERVLDLACGTGAVARQVAPLVGPRGAVTGVDLNPAMLAVARSLPAPDGAAVDWREGDAQSLPLPDASFDLALCQAGLQFVPDKAAAAREIYRVLRPGGRFAVSAWRSLDYLPASLLIWGAVARRLQTTPYALSAAWALGDPALLRALLEEAGFREVALDVQDYTVREPREAQLIKRILSSIAGVLPAIGALSPVERDALAAEVEDDIAPALAAFVVGDEQLYPMSAHIAIGTKP
jgi:SAM-dependent methyltransferase